MGSCSGRRISIMSRLLTVAAGWKSSTVTRKKLLEDTLVKFPIAKDLISATLM